MSAADQIRQFSQLTQKAIKSAAARSLNTAATTARAEAARLVKEQLPELKIGDIKARIDMDRASAREDLETMKASITGMRKPFPLVLFAARARNVKTPKGARVGVTVKVRGERKLVGHAFLAETKGGYVGVFMRSGDSRFPIKQLYSTSVANVFNDLKFYAAISRLIYETVNSNFSRELAYQVSKAGGG